MIVLVLVGVFALIPLVVVGGWNRMRGLDAAARRWRELAAEDAADPALRRCAAVKDAYLAGEFDYDELDWRILLALMPPPPTVRRVRSGRVEVDAFPTHSMPWSAAAPASASIPWTATPAPCGHDMAVHSEDGCNECARESFVASLARAHGVNVEPLPTEPDPRLVSYGEHLGHRPPKPSDSARSVRPARRQSHG